MLLRRVSDVAPYTSASTAAAYNALQENEHLPLDDFVLRLRKWAQVRTTAVRSATGLSLPQGETVRCSALAQPEPAFVLQSLCNVRHVAEQCVLTLPIMLLGTPVRSLKVLPTQLLTPKEEQAQRMAQYTSSAFPSANTHLYSSPHLVRGFLHFGW